MPFLAPAIPSIISSVGGSLLGKAFGGPSAAQNNATSALTTLSNTAGNQGMSFLNGAGTADNYFQSILKGNMAEPTTALAPDISRVRNATNNTFQATTNLAPRGGGRGSTLFSLPGNENAQEQGVFNGARPAAANGLAQLGGLGANLTGTAVSGTNALLGNLAQQREQQFQTGALLGSGLYNAAKGIDWKTVFGGGA